jgi:hypothetical protein
MERRADTRVRPDGLLLCYQSEFFTRMMVLDVEQVPSLAPEQPRRLFYSFIPDWANGIFSRVAEVSNENKKAGTDGPGALSL